MATIQENLIKIATYKQDIKNAIEYKGQSVSNNLSEFAEAIYKISGGEPEPVIPEIPETDPLTFIKLDDGEGSIGWTMTCAPPTKTIQYRKNDGEWVDYVLGFGVDLPKIPMSKGDKLQWKYDGTNAFAVRGEATTTLLYTSFTTDGIYACGGTLASLHNNNTTTALASMHFAGLFRYTNIVSAPVIPFKALGTYCYYLMFSNCYELIKVPENMLPATSLTNYCYYGMFNGCNKLKNVPNLPAKTATGYCYYQMFNNCSSLEHVPENLLPATITTSYTYCYYQMFYGCTNLKNAPILPSKTTSSYCYYQMFYNCDSLKTLPENMIQATSVASYSCDGMFYSCNSLESVPENLLPATTLGTYCYYQMFYSCYNLKNVPNLPARTLQTYCYYQMFYGCRSLESVPEDLLPATTLANYCYYGMFGTCYNLKNVPNLPATTLYDSCYYYMFVNCTSLESVPENLLPATTLVNACYYSMFRSCTMLKNAPILPAKTLATLCYYQMFSNCLNLLSAKIYAENILNVATSNGTMMYMFWSCRSLTDLYCMAKTYGTTTLTNVIGTNWLQNAKNTAECTFHKNPNWTGPTARSVSTVPSNWNIVDWVEE